MSLSLYVVCFDRLAQQILVEKDHISYESSPRVLFLATKHAAKKSKKGYK